MNNARNRLLDQITGKQDEQPTRPMSINELADEVAKLREDMNRLIELANTLSPGEQLPTGKSLKGDAFWAVKRKG